MLDKSSGNVQPQLLGDIVISVETAEKQALNRKFTLYKELCILFIHGMLHLLGYDHDLSKKDAEEMRKQETKIFEGIIKDKKIKGLV